MAKQQDKILAIGGVALIIILAVVAIVLLMRVDDSSSSLVKIKPNTEQIELVEEAGIEVTPEVKEQEKVLEEETAPTQAVEEKSTDTVTDTLKSTENEFYVRSSCREIRNTDNQMAELYGYWDEYKLEAVNDLIRLERVRMLTKSLASSNEYYYYGETDASNVPNGKGLAIYADDTYYFGEWSKGLRSGNGMWLRIYPDGATNVGRYTGVLEHQYNGQFKNDLPNGNGQEHYTYKEGGASGELSIANAIGGFKNGYYSGEIYIMTIDSDDRTYDWYADALNGVFKYQVENAVSTTGKKPVLKKGDDNDHSTDASDDGFYWMYDKENTGFGVYGLKK